MEPENIENDTQNINSIDLAYEFTELNRLRHRIKEETRSIDEAVQILETKKQEITAPYYTLVQEREKRIREAVIDKAASFKCPVGKATYRKEYERASWDDKKLQGYAIQNPDIMTCRNVTIVQASVSISVGEQK